MLEIKNIIKKYKMPNHEVIALNDVSFNVKPGNLVAIVGPSGCGKTTLMNIIGALDSDFEGEVIIDGKSLKKARDLDSYRKNSIGFIFQNFTLINSLNTFQNVALALQVSGQNKQYINDKVNNLLASVGLSEQANKKVNLLSGGQKQRVAIARALANDPDIIIADEPTGALDEETGLQVMNILKEIAKTKIVIMVTHSPELAAEYADEIISMEDGKIIEIKSNHKTKEVRDIEKEDETKSSMSFWTAFMLALRNFKIKKARTIWTAIGLSIGIIGIALALALSTGTKDTITNQVYAIFPANDIYVTNKHSSSLSPKKLNYDDYLEVKKLVGDKNSVIFYPEYIIPILGGLSKESVNLKNLTQMGASKDSDAIMPGNINLASRIDTKLAYGHKPKATNEIVISLSTAENLITDSKKVSDLLDKDFYLNFINIDNNKNEVSKLKIVGITSENTLLNIIYFSDNYLDSMLKNSFNINIKNVETGMINVSLNKNENVDEFISKVNKETKNLVFEGASKSILNTVGFILDGVRNGLIAFSSISVFVAILMIGIVVYISVIERKQEIGIIRAIGGRKKDIRNIFLSESFIIGLLAGIIGVGVAYLISLGINNIVQSILNTMSKNTPSFNVADLKFEVALLLILICTIISIISGIIPSLKAANLDPVEAIRKK